MVLKSLFSNRVGTSIPGRYQACITESIAKFLFNEKDLQILTGVMTVKSGRCVPPALGWLLSMTSPSFKSSPNVRI